MKYKRRRVRRNYVGRRRTERNRSKITVSLIILFVIAVFVGSVVLGNYLKEKAEISKENRYNDEIKETESSSGEGDIEPPENILKAPEELRSAYISFDAEIVPESGSAVSFAARDASGVLRYSSEVAMGIGAQKENTLITLSQISEKTSDLYTSAFFALDAIPEENTPLTGLYDSLWLALFSEMSLAGVDEIILYGFDESRADEEIARFSALAGRFRADNKESKTLLGIMLPYSFFERDDASKKCAELAGRFEIIAADLTDTAPSEEKTAADLLAERVKLMQIFFSRYSVRAVINSDSAEHAEMLYVLDSAYVNLAQSVSAYALAGETEE